MPVGEITRLSIMKPTTGIVFITWLFVCVVTVGSAAPSLVDAAGPPTWPSVEQVEARLKDLQQRHPKRLKLEVVGRSAQGRSIYLAQLTDPSVPDDHKERVLLTALHSGIERSGTTGTFAIMEWLLSNDHAAKETLRRQRVFCLPMVNPDGYAKGTHANSLGLDPYTQWTVEGPKDPDRAAEAVAIQKIMDEFQVEVHADVHGHNMAFPGYYHVESSGRAYSNLSLRPYRSAIVGIMDAAAEQEGYGSDRLEEDAERALGSSALGIAAEKLWIGVVTAPGAVGASLPRVYAAVYGYNRYHTMTLASECAWERSALLRHKALLEVGNAVWPGEYYAGYPTRVIMKNGFHIVTAYGRTAAERRHSRVELWNQQRQITHGMSNPQMEGRVLYVCATSPEVAKQWLTDRKLQDFAAKLSGHPGMDGAHLREFVRAYPEGPGQWGETSQLLLEGGAAGPGEVRPIEHGLALRLRVPFPKARRLDLRLNGRAVPKSEVDGYVSWVARGFTHVQINLPPERVKKEHLFLVTLQFDPGEWRTQGAGWEKN